MLWRGARAFCVQQITKSETQIGARGFVAVEVVWRLGAWLAFGLFSLAASMSG